jgi:hypothetical protein
MPWGYPLMEELISEAGEFEIVVERVEVPRLLRQDRPA